MTRARVGGILLVVILVGVLVAVVVFNRSGPCAQAQDAYTIAMTSPSAEDRSNAFALYLVKKAECEAGGGTVR